VGNRKDVKICHKVFNNWLNIREGVMKVSSAIISFFILLLIPLFCVSAANKNNHEFYKNCIENEIERCTRQARLANSKGINMQKYGLKSLNKAKFYQSNKDQLIKEMVQLNLPDKQYKIEYFLISAFNHDYNSQNLIEK
jgi:CHASE1-domain containing sensor protein